MTRRQSVPARKPSSSLRMVQPAGETNDPRIAQIELRPDGMVSFVLAYSNGDYLDGQTAMGITLNRAQRRKLGEFLLREDV